MCAYCVSSSLEGWPILLVDGSGAEGRVRHDLTRSGLVCQDFDSEAHDPILSHRAAYARIVAEGLPGAIILGGGGAAGHSFAGFVKAGGYLGADLIILEHAGQTVWRWRRKRTTAAGIWLLPLRQKRVRGRSYCLSRRVAKALLAAGTDLPSGVDLAHVVPGISAAATMPALVEPRLFATAAATPAMTPHFGFTRRLSAGI